MSRIEEADKMRRSIERGEPQPTYMSKRQKDALQVLIDLILKGQTLMPQKQEGSNNAGLSRREAVGFVPLVLP